MTAVPAELPVTSPTTSTPATAGSPLLHTPPPEASVSTVEVVGQTVKVPAIVPAFGKAITVTITVAAIVPQPLVTV